jgi:hypothetical protein
VWNKHGASKSIDTFATYKSPVIPLTVNNPNIIWKPIAGEFSYTWWEFRKLMIFNHVMPRCRLWTWNLQNFGHYMPQCSIPCHYENFSHSMPPCSIPSHYNFFSHSMPPCLISCHYENFSHDMPPCSIPCHYENFSHTMPPCLIPWHYENFSHDMPLVENVEISWLFFWPCRRTKKWTRPRLMLLWIYELVCTLPMYGLVWTYEFLNLYWFVVGGLVRTILLWIHNLLLLDYVVDAGYMCAILLLDICYINYVQTVEVMENKKRKNPGAFAVCMHTAKDIWSPLPCVYTRQRSHVVQACAPSHALVVPGGSLSCVGERGRTTKASSTAKWPRTAKITPHDKGWGARQRPCHDRESRCRAVWMAHDKDLYRVFS